MSAEVALSSGTHYTPLNSDSTSAASSGFIDRFSKRFGVKLDEDWSYRQKKLFLLSKFLDSSIYDNLQPFHQEYDSGNENGNYIPLAKRRPSITYNLSKIIVDESISLLFGDDHFPVVRCGGNEEKNEDIEKYLQSITRNCGLKSILLDAAKKGSIGSVCIAIKVLEGEFYFEALDTITLTPYFKKMKPHELERVVERKKYDGFTLQSYGYSISDDDKARFFYLKREWNETGEIFYKPYLVEKEKDRDFSPQQDDDKSSLHNLGFVPLIWIKNLPAGRNIDGASTFESVIDISIEIDYQLSQLGRLIKYNSDPTFVIKNPSTIQGKDIFKSLSILQLDEKGDAYYAEISGKSCEPAMAYVKQLREYALEVARGNRTNPDKISAVQSGKAVQMLNSALISLVSEMRITYGDEGLLKIYKMILLMSKDDDLKVNYEIPASLDDANDLLTLDWPDWYPKIAQEELQEAQTLTTYTNSGLLSKKTAINSIADEYNILDIDAEVKDIENEKKQEYTLTNSSNTMNNKGKRGAPADSKN